MKLLIVFSALFATQIHAAQFTVNDITKDNKIVYTPGISTFYGKCNYTWSGLKKYRFSQFMEGASSYSMDTVQIGTNTRCINIKTDISDVQIKIPYVNQEAFRASANPPRLDVARVVTASTKDVGSIFRLSDSLSERNVTNIEAGVFGTPSYFRCEIHNDNLALKWLRKAGIESEISPGHVLSMSWITSHRHCSDIRMTFDPKLLIKPTTKPVEPNPAPIDPTCL
jgi:hypothetical protein